jgi:hypothetical protein
VSWAPDQIAIAIERVRLKRDVARFVDIMSELRVEGRDYRVIDRALQKARKAGAVRYDSKQGWLVCYPEVLPQRDHEQATDRDDRDGES